MSEESFTIRFAVEDDCPLILSFIKELAEYENMSEFVTADEGKLRASLFKDRQAEVIIGEENGTPVAFALFFSNYSTFLGKANIYLEDLFVREGYRGKGYGKALFKRLAEITMVRGCERLDWACLDWNEPAIEFYKRLGAKAMDEWTAYRLEGAALELN